MPEPAAARALQDVLTLFALGKYNGQDFSDLACHLTNTCRQAPATAEEEAAAVGLLADLPGRIADEGHLSLQQARHPAASAVSTLSPRWCHIFVQHLPRIRELSLAPAPRFAVQRVVRV